MPITTTHDRDSNLTIHTADGKLTFTEIASTLDAFYLNDHAPENVLWDGRNATLTGLTQEQLQQLATYPKKFQKLPAGVKKGRRAILAATNVDYGMARVINTLKELLAEDLPFELRTFRSYNDAVNWLKGK